MLITGGAGFIGSAVVRHLLHDSDDEILVLDKFTQAASLGSQRLNSERLAIRKADICDARAVADAFSAFAPDCVMHLAAETHVDRSIDDPGLFVQVNVVGTMNVLEAAREHWQRLGGARAERFRFHHISTDEVFGTAAANEAFTELTRYDPRSPYSASKASSDHLVRAWHHTFGLPVVLSNCSNNYGPWQYPEKFIPRLLMRALNGETLPVYGNGQNIRDWLHVDDHARALALILKNGALGQSYNVGGRAERTNIAVAKALAGALDELCPAADGSSYADRIVFVEDRPGHDLRYAIDATKVERDLGWSAAIPFEDGLRKTIAWYLENRDWCDSIRAGSYDGSRLGLRATA